VDAVDLIAESHRLEQLLLRPPLIRCRGKRALDEGWPEGPFEDPDRWRARLADHVGNVGLVMGRGMLTVDADTYKDGGQDALEALVVDTGLDVATVTGLTGRGGTHLLYSYPSDRCPASVPLTPRGYPCIEVKASGGYVVVEPSIHPDNGRPYRWEINYGPGVVDVAEAPAKLLELLDPASSWRRPAGGSSALDPANVAAAELLDEHFGGHDVVVEFGGYLSIRRPGKEQGSHSATIGVIGPGVVKVWSDNWPPFRGGGVYDLGQLRAMAGLGPRLVDDVPPLYTMAEGFRLWTPEDEDEPRVPVLGAAAFHGVVGDFLHTIEAETESALPAIGAMTLTRLGTLIGRRAALNIGEHRQHANLFVAIVGPTSSGAKGTADIASRKLIELVCPKFATVHEVGGFGSGEALFDDVADDVDPPNEKRRVVTEDEFSVVLRVSRRESSILSEMIRKAFDYRPLQHRTRTGGKRWATDHHISVVGSTTPAELRALSAELDIENGWLNRFLFVDSRLVRLLPFGGHFDPAALRRIANRIDTALGVLEQRPAINGIAVHYRLDEGSAAAQLWAPWYGQVRDGVGSGALAAVTRRQHVQAARLAVIYAVLDQSLTIEPEHLRAGQAWCDFGVQTAANLFGPVAGSALKLLVAIREMGEDGLDGRSQSAVFGRNVKAAVIEEFRRHLEALALVRTFSVSTGGRPRQLSVAVVRT
jgi:hypothetical protein